MFFMLVLIGFLFYPLDYYIYKPGNTYNTADFVTVDRADRDDEGSIPEIDDTEDKYSKARWIQSHLAFLMLLCYML